MDGNTPTGIILWILWAIEALIIVGLAVGLAFGMSADTPFCEDCEKWVDGVSQVPDLTAIHDPSMFANNLERKNWDTLFMLEKQLKPSRSSTTLTLKHCESCDSSRFLQVDMVTIGVDKDGNDEVNSTTLMENLIINRNDFTLINEHNWGKDIDPTPAKAETPDMPSA